MDSSAVIFRPIKIVSFELTDSTDDITCLDGYQSVRALVRLHGSALGLVDVPIQDTVCEDTAIRRAACERLAWPIIRHLIMDALADGIRDPKTSLDHLTTVAHATPPWPLASITVAVCTRDRSDDLARCLDALLQLDPAPDEILVIDNAPRSDTTERLVAAYPSARYVRESRPGLDWARNRAVREASSEIIAFTDDDVVVDPGWVGALLTAFEDRSDVMAVTGLVMPFELETEAQELFERYGGFSRGFHRRWCRVDTGESAARLHGGTGKFGTGANMAFRRSVFTDIGLFDPALDVGTVTNGGGDLEMFYRVLKAGHVLLYEPDAIVWHRHRRQRTKLVEQLTNNGIGFYSYLVRSAFAWKRDRWSFIRLGAWWLYRWNIRRLLVSWYKPGAFPRDLVLAELVGSFKGLFRYQRARRIAVELGAIEPLSRGANAERDTRNSPEPDCVLTPSVQTVDIATPISGLEETGAHAGINIVVTRGDRLLGDAHVENAHRRVSARQVRQAIADALSIDVFSDGTTSDRSALWARALDRAVAAFAPVNDGMPQTLDSSIDASIVVATRDRPDELRRALASLSRLHTRRRVEIIVVDNHPASRRTPLVVAEFPGIRLVSETRGGLSYARNAGIAASTGAVVVATDDDVVVPSTWLETLLAPFADAEVMAVTGNVLPFDLSTKSQRLFERYGGLGRGLHPYTVDRDWFWAFRGAVPTWNLGGTANAAFRSTIFHHPDIGLLDEALGAGTPTGCSEDTDLFYRILRAGYRIVYAPNAYVWHRHRADMRALRRQIYAYAKGHAAYQLTTLTRHHDWRALMRLFVELPRVYLWRLRERLTGRGEYPAALVMLEIAGTLAGPWAWWQSRRRVRHLGRSAPYVPVSDRAVQSVEGSESLAADLIA